MAANSQTQLVCEVWAEKIWSFVAKDFEDLASLRPKTQEDGAVGRHYGASGLVTQLQRSGEWRAVCCNICWTPPLGTSEEEKALTLNRVDRFVEVVFWNKELQVPAAPKRWDRKLHIPIICTSRDGAPEKGEMQRLGLHIVVVAFWRAWARAKEMGRPASELEAFHGLALDAIFDFAYYSSEESIFIASSQLLESNEMMREWCGMSGTRLIDAVLKAKTLLQKTCKPTAADIATWLEKNIDWADSKRIPKPEKVTQCLTIGDMFEKCVGVKKVVDLAEVLFGRDNMFDEYSKLLLIVQRASIPKECQYVFEGLFAQMVRSNNTDTPSKAELTHKAGPLHFWLFVQKYFQHLLQVFPFQDPDGNKATKQLQDRLRAVLQSPLQWLQEFPENPPPGSLSWVGGLALYQQKLLDHALNVMSGTFNTALKGLLGSPPPGGATPKDALKMTAIAAVYNDIVKEHKGTSSNKDPPKEGDPPKKEAGKAPTSDKDTDSWARLKEDCETKADDTLRKKLILIVPKVGGGATLQAMLQAQQVTQLNTRMLAFYDPKNFTMAKTYNHHSWYANMPLVDSEDLKAWCLAVDSVMKHGMDFAVILSGKVYSNEEVIIRLLCQVRWEYKRIVLLYDIEGMRAAGYFRRVRGVANAAATELAFLCWKGSLPKNFSPSRSFVDKGSSTWVDYMTNVPVANTADIATVDRTLSETLFPHLYCENTMNVNENAAAEDSDGNSTMKEPVDDEEADKRVFQAWPCLNY